MTNSYVLQCNKVDNEQKGTMQHVMNLYGIALFLGLLISIFRHGIEDLSGFMPFLLACAALYFPLVTFYFKGGRWRSVVFVTVSLIATASLFMAVFLQLT